jgi:hypothetical protein
MQKDIIFQQSLSHKQLQNYHTNSKRNLGEIQAMIDALEKNAEHDTRNSATSEHLLYIGCMRTFSSGVES